MNEGDPFAMFAGLQAEGAPDHFVHQKVNYYTFATEM